MINSDPQRSEELDEALSCLPRVSLAALPTPLEKCPGLTQSLSGPNIWVKRDDLTGLAFGGNKTRMLEFVLGKALEDRIDTIVAGAGVQSNYCRQLAAACRKLGLDCHLVLRKLRGEKDSQVQGGLLLDLLLGAQIEFIQCDSWSSQGDRIRNLASKLETQGKRVYVARLGNESGLGRYACGYVQACVEILNQAEQLNLKIDQMWVCSSDATQAGLAIALKHVGSSIRLVGIPAVRKPILPNWSFGECIAHHGNECAEILGLQTRLAPEEIISILDYVGPDYGVPTEQSLEAMHLAARSDAILLDPVYTSKTMAGLIDHIRKGLIPSAQNVLFIHTGGLPALFAYADEMGLEQPRSLTNT